MSCLLGKVSEAGAGMGDCKPCNPGFYSGYSKTACSACAAGRFQPQSGQSMCEFCPAGKAGVVLNATNETLGCSIHCRPGTYRAASSYTAATTCVDCPSNRYSDSFLSASCTFCPSTMYTTSTRSTSLANCTCQPGYGTGSGASPPATCTACVAGKFKSEHGNHDCQNCSAG